MAKSYSANPRSQELRDQSYHDIRMGAAQRAFGPGGIQFSSSDERGLFDDPRSLSSIVAKTRLQHTLADSTVDLGHLNGLQFAHVTRNAGYIPGGRSHAVYYPRSRSMIMNHSNVDWADPGQAARADYAEIHELGHHVENMTRGKMSSRGRAEAHAENYAEQHAPGRMVWHQGVGVEYRAGSTYDSHVPHPDSPVFNEGWDPAGKYNRAIYAKTRARGTMPNEY